jgi:DNA (cytosine-5)-methyltransferase 1
MGLEIVSLFSGCGGLDLGFSQAGFDVVWANEFDKDIWETYEQNHPTTVLDKRDIRKIDCQEIPDCIGIIGGPPCQSWSEAGTQKGIDDERGQLFSDYVRILQDKQPLFFLAENVSGMLHKKHSRSIENIVASFEKANYVVSFKLLNAVNYNVPQDRKRVIFVGYHQSLNKQFDFNSLIKPIHVPTLRKVIWGLRETVQPANNLKNPACAIANHEYMQGGFSSIYMSRNRVRAWDEPSFTIQAGGRHAPIHPQASKMIHVDVDKWIFDPESPAPYRRLSVRECARVQTFPDNFIFHYKNIIAAYKMIGNAVPVNFSYAIAQAIKEDLSTAKTQLKSYPSMTKILQAV